MTTGKSDLVSSVFDSLPLEIVFECLSNLTYSELRSQAEGKDLNAEIQEVIKNLSESLYPKEHHLNLSAPLILEKLRAIPQKKSVLMHLFDKAALLPTGMGAEGERELRRQLNAMETGSAALRILSRIQDQELAAPIGFLAEKISSDLATLPSGIGAVISTDVLYGMLRGLQTPNNKIFLYFDFTVEGINSLADLKELDSLLGGCSYVESITFSNENHQQPNWNALNHIKNGLVKMESLRRIDFHSVDFSDEDAEVLAEILKARIFHRKKKDAPSRETSMLESEGLEDSPFFTLNIKYGSLSAQGAAAILEACRETQERIVLTLDSREIPFNQLNNLRSIVSYNDKIKLSL